jgi:hypothetical protein
VDDRLDGAPRNFCGLVGAATILHQAALRALTRLCQRTETAIVGATH